MSRKKTIDRDELLDLAEEIIRTHGARALTIDALAKAARITNGGVQYTFRNKQGLIDAMFERWGESYDELFVRIAGPNPDPVAGVRAHVEATRQSDASSNSKAASLMTALLQTPEHMGPTRHWFRQRIADLDMTTDEGRRARLAFFATEGVFAMRFFGLMNIGEDEWMEIMRDIAATIR